MRSRGAAAAALLAILAASPAGATPVFAHRYGVRCQTCHTIVPRLNAFGEKFAAAGYRWPAPIPVHETIPVAVKSNLAYTGAPSALPKATVDEVEFLLMATAGGRWTYRVEQYVVDGGVPGNTRDAYVQYFSDPASAWRGVTKPVLDVKGGQFTLPLPNDPETQRPTELHYALYDQTVGANPFNFFDDRIGLDAHLALRGGELWLLALKGHDAMAVARVGTDPLSLYGYRYSGRRPLGRDSDAFTRSGIGVKSISGKSRAALVLQTGYDSSPFGSGLGAASSGGYLQEEWAFSDRLIGVVRYDGTSAPGSVVRSTTAALNVRVRDRARFTVEDVIGHSPATTNTLNVGFLFAY